MVERVWSVTGLSSITELAMKGTPKGQFGRFLE
jgi:hypothetical protein